MFGEITQSCLIVLLWKTNWSESPQLISVTKARDERDGFIVCRPFSQKNNILCRDYCYQELKPNGC